MKQWNYFWVLTALFLGISSSDLMAVSCESGGRDVKPCIVVDDGSMQANETGEVEGYVSLCDNLGGNPTVFRCNVEVTNPGPFCFGDSPELIQVPLTQSGSTTDTVDLTVNDCDNLGGTPTLYSCGLAVINRDDWAECFNRL